MRDDHQRAAVRTQGRREAAPAAATRARRSRWRSRSSASRKDGSCSGSPGGSGSYSQYPPCFSRSIFCSRSPARVSFDRAWRRWFCSGLLAAGNFAALGILVAGLVTARHSRSQRRRAPAYRVAIYTTDIVGLRPHLLGGGGRRAVCAASMHTRVRQPDFRFPQDEDRERSGLEAAGLGLPLRLADELDRVQPDGHDAALAARRKLLMGLESFVSAITVFSSRHVP